VTVEPEWSQTNRQRELFLSSAERQPAVSVSTAIAASWQRSRLSGLNPDVFTPQYSAPDSEQHRRLLRAVGPVVQRLQEQLSGCSMAVIVADSCARIVDRWVDDVELERHLDRIMLAPGYSYAEDSVGTNAIGTALEQGRPSTVVGAEHFAGLLQNMACAAALVRDPRTGRVIGVIDLTARRRSFTPLMLVVGLQTVRDVESRLCDEASLDERVLLSRFLKATRHTHRPVVAISRHVLIENTTAADLLGVTDHGVLIQEVRRLHEETTPHDVTVQMANAAGITARLQPVFDGGRFVGAVAMLDRRSRSISSLHAGPGASNGDGCARVRRVPLVGRSNAWTTAVAEAAVAAGGRRRLLIEGEPGVGKLALARAMHELHCSDEPFVVRDAADTAAVDMTDWIEDTASVLAGPPATVAIRHVELLDATVTQKLAQTIDRTSDNSAVWLIATIRTGHLNSRPPLIDRFPNTVAIPPLRQRVADVPLLIEHFLADRKCAPGVVSALVAQHWHGNVRELRELLHSICEPPDHGAPISLTDLPFHYRLRRPRGLAPLHQAQFNAIVDALAICRGNKARAAQRLGISRSSLYRKMEAFEIPGTWGC
jgi:sigma-54 dependent transcriptional regulator, acetoin dehydrogenase operon transcriptional activator AcoR